jgi:hypothetical protein
MGVLDDAIREHLELKRSRGATDDEIARDEAEALGPARRERAADPNAGFVEALSEEGDAVAPPPPPPAAEEAPIAAEAAHDELALPPDEAPLEDLEPVAEAEPPGEPEPPTAVEPEPPTAVEPEPAVEPPTAIEEPAASFDEPTAVHQPPAVHEPPEPVAGDEMEPDEVPADERLSGPPPALSDETVEYDVLADIPPGAGVEDELVDEAPPPRAVPPPPLADDPSAPPAPARPPAADADAEPGEDEDLLEETPDFLQETPEHDRLWFEQKPPRDFDFDD